MFKRLFLALLITLSIYSIPPMLYNVSGHWAWIDAAFWSCTYVVLIYRYAKTRLMPLMLAAESLALFSMMIAFTEHYVVKQDWFFYQNYESIINVCFAAELIIIAVGVIDGGPAKRIQRVWHLLIDSISHRRSFVFSGEKLV